MTGHIAPSPAKEIKKQEPETISVSETANILTALGMHCITSYEGSIFLSTITPPGITLGSVLGTSGSDEVCEYHTAIKKIEEKVKNTKHSFLRDLRFAFYVHLHKSSGLLLRVHRAINSEIQETERNLQAYIDSFSAKHRFKNGFSIKRIGEEIVLTVESFEHTQRTTAIEQENLLKDAQYLIGNFGVFLKKELKLLAETEQ